MDLDYFKQKLEEELNALEKDLGQIARRDPQNPENWELRPDPKVAGESRDEVADRLEDQDETAQVELQLERRLRDVRLALEKIKAGRFGFCEICQAKIELGRLQANPAARTCKTHLQEGDRLL